LKQLQSRSNAASVFITFADIASGQGKSSVEEFDKNLKAQSQDAILITGRFAFALNQSDKAKTTDLKSKMEVYAQTDGYASYLLGLDKLQNPSEASQASTLFKQAGDYGVVFHWIPIPSVAKAEGAADTNRQPSQKGENE
jgi:hypothetical protein